MHRGNTHFALVLSLILALSLSLTFVIYSIENFEDACSQASCQSDMARELPRLLRRAASDVHVVFVWLCRSVWCIVLHQNHIMRNLCRGGWYIKLISNIYNYNIYREYEDVHRSQYSAHYKL